jgi:hypothetical protein
LPIVRNTSDHNIIINEKVVLPTKSIAISQDQIEDVQNLIDKGMLRLEPQTVNRVENFPKFDESKRQEFDEIKARLMPALFSLHLNQELSDEELRDLKWFYKNIGPTSQLDNNLKSLLDDVVHTEEFLEVLLNHLYSELIKNSIK